MKRTKKQASRSVVMRNTSDTWLEAAIDSKDDGSIYLVISQFDTSCRKLSSAKIEIYEGALCDIAKAIHSYINIRRGQVLSMERAMRGGP